MEKKFLVWKNKFLDGKMEKMEKNVLPCGPVGTWERYLY